MKDNSLIAYESDASGLKGKASEIFFPTTKEEIQKLIRENSKLTIRGAGTGLAGGAVPQNEIVVDLSKMNHILSFENKIVEVEAGVVLDDLNDFLDKYNLEFPVKPSSHSVCTIGGMIACNAAGERAVKYGKMSKWTEAVEIIDGKGEIQEIHKFNLNDIIGLEGITGIIVKAKLRVIEKKKHTASLISFDSIGDVVNFAENYSSNENVSEIEFLDKMTSGILGLPEKYHLLIEFETLEGEMKDALYEEIMKKRAGLYPALASLGYVRIEDPKIILSRFEELAGLLESMKIPYYGHLGMGIIHHVFKEEETDKIKKLFSLVKRLKGSVSGEHGIGILKKEFVEDNEKKLMILVKKRYDPHNKLNPGKVIESLELKKTEAQERRLEELEKIEEAIEIQNKENEK